MTDVISVVEEGFRKSGKGRVRMPAKTIRSLEHGDFGEMPAALPGCSGGEEVNVEPQNVYRGAP